MCHKGLCNPGDCEGGQGRMAGKDQPQFLVSQQDAKEELLIEELLHHLISHPIIYREFYIRGGCLGFLPSTYLCVCVCLNMY